MSTAFQGLDPGTLQLMHSVEQASALEAAVVSICFLCISVLVLGLHKSVCV